MAGSAHPAWPRPRSRLPECCHPGYHLPPELQAGGQRHLGLVPSCSGVGSCSHAWTPATDSGSTPWTRLGSGHAVPPHFPPWRDAAPAPCSRGQDLGCLVPSRPRVILQVDVGPSPGPSRLSLGSQGAGPFCHSSRGM